MTTEVGSLVSKVHAPGRVRGVDQLLFADLNLTGDVRDEGCSAVNRTAEFVLMLPTWTYQGQRAFWRTALWWGA